MGNKKVGILDKGKNTQIIDCEFEGFDIGIQSEGENLKSKGNKIINNLTNKYWYEIWWVKYLFFPLIVAIISGFIVFIINYFSF